MADATGQEQPAAETGGMMGLLRRLAFPAYLVAVVSVVCIALEWFSLELNKRADAAEPFMWGDPIKFSLLYQRGFALADPHLGYAYGPNEQRVKDLAARGYAWQDGFAIYHPPGTTEIARPIILTLGGSTTDPVQYGHSWPEELAKQMEAQGIAGTVVNGGAGGYASSQELLKLIRDGVEIAPDIVISYSGVNDRGAYGRLPHPLVHSHQRQFYDTLLHPRSSPVMPNTVAFIRRAVGSATAGGSVRDYSLGFPTELSLPGWYLRNIKLMEAVSSATGARFFPVLQPNAYVGDFPWAEDFVANEGKGASYIASVRRFYAEIKSRPEHATLHDFTGIFSDLREAYDEDGIHTTPAGERVIAARMLDLIRPTLVAQSSGTAIVEGQSADRARQNAR